MIYIVPQHLSFFGKYPFMDTRRQSIEKEKESVRERGHSFSFFERHASFENTAMVIEYIGINLSTIFSSVSTLIFV
jgi:hypothetical protein